MAALSRTRWLEGSRYFSSRYFSRERNGDRCSRCVDSAALAGSLRLYQLIPYSAQSSITFVTPCIESLFLCGKSHGAPGFAQVTTVEEFASRGELVHFRKTQTMRLEAVDRRGVVAHAR